MASDQAAGDQVAGDQEQYIIVGTAGHVDHGKTVLVRALTGVDTDRLKEEKERGISIELGFAPLVLPSGRRVGLVDVPGHERFIRHMLAGVAGIDLVLMVVAADEGVMPQTREHLDILNLLQVKQGLIAITKIDLVDEEWLALVEEDVRQAVEGSVLEGAPLIPVSAVTGKGLDQLLAALDALVAQTPAREVAGPARLPIDRVFTIAGFGTVVTGTLWSGSLRVGQTVSIYPAGKSVRIRSLQVHGEPVEAAYAGQRVAVNLAGIEVNQVERGQVLAESGSLKPSWGLGADLYLLASARRPLTHGARVRFHLGTSEILARIRLLGQEELAPGDSALVQIHAEEPVCARRGDRFVIRSYSPIHTIGGGTILDPAAGRRRRRREEVVKELEILRAGRPEDLAIEALKTQEAEAPGPGAIAAKSGLDLELVTSSLHQLEQQGRVVCGRPEGAEPWFMTASTYQRLWKAAEQALRAYHQQRPLRSGLPKEELRSRLGKVLARLSPRTFNLLLSHWEAQGKIKVLAQEVRLAGFDVQVPPGLQAALSGLVEAYRQGGFTPPAWEEAVRQQGLDPDAAQELLHYLLRRGELVRIGEDTYFGREALEEAQAKISAFLDQHGQITLGQARDLLGSTRKYVLPLLEYLDQIKFTRRQGDLRVRY